MPFEDNNEIITGFFETNITPHRHTATDLLVNMDPEYVYQIAKAATGAMLHFTEATTNPLDVDSFTKNQQVLCYPNPVSDLLHIHFGSLPQTPIAIQLIDVHGKRVYNHEISEHQLTTSIDVSSLPKGMYLLDLRSSTFQKTQKVIID